MNYLAELQQRFEPVLGQLVDDPAPLLEMIRPTQDPKHGDYQANFAMPLCKQLQRPKEGPQVAREIIDQVDFSGLCETAEVAGPGFINLRIAADRLAADINAAAGDDRLGVPVTSHPKTVVIDFSSPNIAKPMHVGHIRSTVIGDSISRTLRFMGHQVITDNHIGDWGTQFGMILYGYKNFLDEDGFQQGPVAELSRLYRLVNQIISYYELKNEKLPESKEEREKLQQHLEEAESKGADDKKAKKALKQLRKKIEALTESIKDSEKRIAAMEDAAETLALAQAHPDIGEAVLLETAKLHEGDEENRQLWEQFLPACRQEMQKIYERLDIHFDHELGESFYHDQLAPVVRQFREAGLAEESDGAICVFLDGFEAPMIIQKKDGAFLYATTDLATIDYRISQWNPDEILYVVDFRQGEHFEKLFAAAQKLGRSARCLHVKFGTVTDKTGKPFKTREGALGLEYLLDLAVSCAHQVVSENDDAKPDGPELEAGERMAIANTVGHAAVKYSDLSHNRESDYEFNEEKMVANEGNTATYMQYSYARIASIIRKSGEDIGALRESTTIELNDPAERALALEVLQLQQAVEDSLADYRPNVLTSYVYGLATKFSKFFENCHVLNSEEPVRSSRLVLCDTVGRTIRLVLRLLGIQVVERM